MNSLSHRRAVLLGRVSRGERTQTSENQLIALRASCERMGWENVEEVSLVSSAWNAKEAADVRAAALAPILQGRADTLMIWAWDRYSREGIEGAFRELRYLEDHLGAQIWSLQEPFLCTTTADKQQRELLLTLVAWVAKWDSQRRSERLKAKVQFKKVRANNLGERGLWGRGQLATDADVTAIKQLRERGDTVRRISEVIGLSKSTVARIVRE